jgi:hypothetical protein
MKRALDHAQKNDADNRALITFAYNRVSIGLYVKHGLFPREPLYTVSVAKEALAGRVAVAPLDGIVIQHGLTGSMEDAVDP